jgi:uncharacterized membrane protein YfcA
MPWWVLEVGVLLLATFSAGFVSAVSGFGGALLLLPIFVLAFGARDAVAVLTIVQLASNLSRVGLNRSEVDRQVVKWFAMGAVPTAVLGSLLLVAAPAPLLTKTMGAFLLIAVVWLRWGPTVRTVSDQALAGVGAASGLGSALVGTVGPLVAPFMLARGLTKGAYIGTEAAAAVVMHVTKLLVFGLTAVLTLPGVGYGLALAPASAGGTYVGKRVVDRLPAGVFAGIVQTGLVVAGALLLMKG